MNGNAKNGNYNNVNYSHVLDQENGNVVQKKKKGKFELAYRPHYLLASPFVHHVLLTPAFSATLAALAPNLKAPPGSLPEPNLLYPVF